MLALLQRLSPTFGQSLPYQIRSIQRPGEHLASRHFCALGQPLVRAVVVEADRLLATVKSTYGAETILWVSHQRPAFDAQRTRAALWSPYTALRELEHMQPAAIEPNATDKVKLLAGWLRSTHNTGSQHPGVYRMALEYLLVFCLDLLQLVPLAQYLRLPARPQMQPHPHTFE